MTIKPLILLCVGAISGSLLTGLATAQESPPSSDKPPFPMPGEVAKTKAFMRQKLLYTQNVIEGLTLENYAMVIDNAVLMRNMTQSNIFFRIKNKQYQDEIAQFSRAIDRLIKAADKGKLKSATKELNKVTLSCVDCHRWFRTKQGQQADDATRLYYKQSTLPE